MSDSKEALAVAMMRSGLGTGHGDTIESLIAEMEWQVTRLQNRIAFQAEMIEGKTDFKGRWERVSASKLARHFGVTAARAQAALNDLGFLYRELASAPSPADRNTPTTQTTHPTKGS